MAANSFVTQWFIPAALERVWESLNTPERCHEW
jgi:hypothetical protein